MRTRKMMLYAGMIASLTMGIFISGAGQQKVEAKTKVTYTLEEGNIDNQRKRCNAYEDEISKEQEDQESYH